MTSSLIHDSAYFVGEKWRRGGPTTRTNKGAETVVVERDALVEVRMRFILENPRSHSLEEMGTVFKAFFKSTKFQGISSNLNNPGINSFLIIVTWQKLLLQFTEIAKEYFPHGSPWTSWLPLWPTPSDKERRGDFIAAIWCYRDSVSD
jgi:hypothetical protein